jgi:meiotically up-regulated gene 157 (Mug157) protein
VGVRSRYLDGAVLEPAFELAGLCAPVVALAAYTRNTGDLSLANDFQVRKVLRGIEKCLQGRKHPQFNLYETTLSPGGQLEPLGFLTYSNVMVWRALLDLAEIKDRCGRDQEGRQFREQAEKVRAAIWQNLTGEGPRGRMFVWASDLKGQKRFGTEPAGCLQLLPYWGFCQDQDLVYRNTVAFAHSPEFQYSFSGAPFEEIGSPSSPQPWMLAVCNSLLSGRRDQASNLLGRLKLDGGLACEAFNSKDGKTYSGEAFAPAAGFLAWSLWKAFGKN